MRDYHRRIICYLKSRGCKGIVFISPKGRGHPKVRFSYADREYRYPVACSPGCDKAAARAISQLRRLIGDIE